MEMNNFKNEQKIINLLKSMNDASLNVVLKDYEEIFKWDENESTSRNIRNLAEIIDTNTNESEMEELFVYLNKF